MEEREGEKPVVTTETVDEGVLHENGVDAGISNKLLHPPPLDPTNTFLSPTASPSFDVDHFLLSRAPGSTLNEITADLQDYSSQLQNQLQIVVDRDYKGFVRLGSALKAEGPRIARLDWKVTPSFAHRDKFKGTDLVLSNGFSSDDERGQFSKASKRASGSNLGLDNVRLEVVHVRDNLRNAENQVQVVMQRRKDAELQKTNLALLTTLNDSLKRLESLLGSSSSEKDTIDEIDLRSEHDEGKQTSFYRLFDTLDDFDDFDDDSGSAEELPLSAHTNEKYPLRPSLNHRRTSSKYQQRITSGPGLPKGTSNGPNGFEDNVKTSSTRMIDLPTLIARGSSEHASLIFLRERAASIGFAAYLAAHEGRFTQVRELLKENLRQLIIMLTRYNGASLLVGHKEVDRGDTLVQDESLLDSWMRASATRSDRQSQQRSWLISALGTWCDLAPSHPESGQDSAAEVEETIRKAMVTAWAQKNINADALDGTSSVPKTPKTPAVFGQSTYFANQQKKVDQDATNGVFLPADIVDPRQDDEQSQALIELYNNILSFVLTHTSEVSAASEHVLLQRRDAQSSRRTSDDHQTNQCDVYVRVVWSEIARRLMEQSGGQLFFAGRPDVFHRNYTISMAFLAAFEKLAPSTRAMLALHKHPTYLTFRKRWQLPVYFQIRLRNAITQLEKALSASGGSQFGVSHRHSMPLMEGTRETIDLFASPWRKDQHIMELAHRQWRLSLQILTRYRNWIEEELPSDIILSNRRVTQEASLHDVNRTSSPTRASTPTLQDSKADDANLSSFTAIAADLLWLEEEVMKSFEKNVIPLFEGHSQDTGSIAEALRDTLRKSLASQRKLIPLLSTRITLILKTRCAEPLRLVRSVSTQFRTQPVNSTSNSEPSSFVVQFLRPIRQYLGLAEGKNVSTSNVEVMSRFLNQETKSQWMTEVIEDLVSKYAASLRTMNKNYESLRRLKRGNVGGSGATGTGFGSLFNRGATTSPANVKAEEDPEAKRMHNQMILDVECLAKDVQELSSVGAAISTDTPAWDRLREAARGEQDDL